MIHRYACPTATASGPLRSRALGSVAGVVPFLFLSASCLGSSVVRYAIHGCASSLLSTPGLRSVTPVRSPFLVPRHYAFPTFGRYDPAARDVANFQRWQRLSMIPNIEPLERSTTLPRFVSRSAGRHRATGLRHAAAIQAAVPSASALYPGWRLPAEDCDALRVRRERRSKLRAVGIPPKVAMASCHRGGRFATRQDAGRTSSGVVIPTACKPVLMESRLAVDFS